MVPIKYNKTVKNTNRENNQWYTNLKSLNNLQTIDQKIYKNIFD